jgi:hypothetical protein
MDSVTDSGGRVVHQIIGPDNLLLSTDTTGRYVDYRGEPIPLDDFNRPLSKENKVLPTNSYGQYVADVQILPTVSGGR